MLWDSGQGRAWAFKTWVLTGSVAWGISTSLSLSFFLCDMERRGNRHVSQIL